MIDKGGIIRGVILLLVVILGLTACASELPEASPPSATATHTLPSPRPSPKPLSSPSLISQPTRTEAQVVEVVDGDTIRVAINSGEVQTVRIIGVDTPETKDPRKPVMCFGVEATAKTQEVVDRASGHVQLEKDVSETDKYGRLLRYVWLIHPDGQRTLNEELVKGGYAQVSTYPPDVKYQEQFLAAQEQARAAGAGLWGECGTFGAPAVIEKPTPPPPADSSTSSSPPVSGGSSFNNTGDKDCKDFATHAEAQAYFTGRGGSPSNNVDRLNNDHDGLACESLP